LRVMVIVKADKDSEAGVMPTEELLAAMGRYNEEELAFRVEDIGPALESRLHTLDAPPQRAQDPHGRERTVLSNDSSQRRRGSTRGLQAATGISQPTIAHLRSGRER
jgi:hypothetical protein